MSKIDHPAVAATRPAFEATGATIVAPDEAEALEEVAAIAQAEACWMAERLQDRALVVALQLLAGLVQGGSAHDVADVFSHVE